MKSERVGGPEPDTYDPTPDQAAILAKYGDQIVERQRRRLAINTEPLAVVKVGLCRQCGKKAPWCSCGAMDYQSSPAVSGGAASVESAPIGPETS